MAERRIGYKWNGVGVSKSAWDLGRKDCIGVCTSTNLGAPFPLLSAWLKWQAIFLKVS